MGIYIKKYPTEIMGLYFSFIFLVLAITSYFISPIDQIVVIPSLLASIIFTLLLGGLIGIYLYANWHDIRGWRKWAELFIMLASICASLSDGFWLFLLVATTIIIIGRISEKRLFVHNNILFAWVVIVVISLFTSFNALESKYLSFGASFGLLLYALFFLAVYNQDFYQERGSEFIQRIGILFSFSITSTVIFSLWHYNIAYKIFVLIFQFQPQTGYGDSFGMASIYGHWPTHSSAFLSLALWVLIGIRCSCSLVSYRKVILNTGIIFSLLGALATLSRNAFLFLVLSTGIAFLLLLFNRKHRKLIFPMLGIGIGFGGVLFFFLSRFSKWRDLLSNPWEQQTIAERLHQYQFGINSILQSENPWFGIGLMNFGPYARRVLDDSTIADYLHQLFLSIGLEIGYIGLIVFLVLLFLIGRNIIINYQRDSNKAIFLIVFFAWLATGIFDNWLYFMWSSSLFMILIALGSKMGTYGSE